MAPTAVDESELGAFLGQVVGDAGAAISVLLTHLGDRLGLYRAMADGEPVSSADLAHRTGTNARLVQEWLSNQAAGGYVTYDPVTAQFRLPAERAAVLADDTSPWLVQGAFDFVAAAFQSIDKELHVFRTGTGLSWGDHHPLLFDATARFFGPSYRAHLLQEWIPALDGVQDQLAGGVRVADVGCGHGTSTVLLADAYPNSTFVGYDYHEPSIEVARAAAEREGVDDRVTFEVADASDLHGPYSLITFFDCWHDTADPLGVARACQRALTPDGSVMLVEPFAGDRLEDNLSPLGRMSYGASTIACTPCSISDGGPGLGSQAGEARVRALFAEAGFGSLHRAAETPFSIVYQARP